MNKRENIKYGWENETIEAKIREVLSLPLEKRLEQGLVKGELAKILERNQKELYGRGKFRTIQVIKPQSS